MKKFVKLLTSALLAVVLVFSVASLAACGNNEKVIKVGASPTPHAEILKDAVAPILEKEGYKLEVVEYNDYVLPNTAVESGELDANYFQHNIYLKDFNAERKTHLKAVANVHYEAFGIYAGKFKGTNLADLPSGAKVLVPNDGTNEARALFLLQKAGLITLKEGTTYSKATKNDIATDGNPKNLDITEVEAAQTAKSLQDADIAVVNGNYALGENLSAALVYEDIPAAEQEQYVNVIAVKEGTEESAKIKALIKAIQSKEVKDYVAEHYKGVVVTVF